MSVAHSQFYTTRWARKLHVNIVAIIPLTVGGPVMAWPLFPPRKKLFECPVQILCDFILYMCRLMSTTVFCIWTGLFRVSKPLNSWFIAPPSLPQHFGTKWPDHFSKADCDPGQLLTHFQNSFAEYGTIRYDTRCYFNVRSKADISRLNLPHGTDN